MNALKQLCAGAIAALLALAAPFAALAQTEPDTAEPAAEAFPSPDALNDARIEGLIDGLLLAGMQDYRAAAATVAIVRDGRIVLTKAYGTARLEPELTPATPDTLFQVASVSKLPVYIAGMQLIEAGTLAMDDPVNTHLPPALHLPHEGFSEPIRIRDLFAHTAGFEDLALGHLFAHTPEKLLPADTYLVRHRPRRVRAPGLIPAYSNYSLVLIGRIVEEKSGLPFADYMEARVLRPLGMETASYRDPIDAAFAAERGLPAPLPEALHPLASQQIGGGPGNWRVTRLELTGPMAAAGGLRVSANDMARLLIALSDPARLETAGVLKAGTFRQMLAGPSVPGTPRVLHGFIPYELPGGLAGYGHNGAMAYSASDFVIVPDLGLGVFVSTNSLGGFSFAYRIAARLTEGLSPSAAPEPLRTPETAAAAKSLAGPWINTRRAYQGSERSVLTISAMTTLAATEEGDLILSPVAGAPRRLYPSGENRWTPYTGGSGLILTSEPDGQARLLSASGAVSLEQAGFWQRAETLVLPILLTFAAGLLALYSWPGRFARRFEHSDRHLASHERWGARALDAAALFWVIGLGGFLATLLQAAADDGAELLFTWPSGIGWAAWVILLAALCTLAGWASVSALFRPAGWSGWRRTKTAAALLLFTFTSLSCWHLGLIG
jgi:CubicO group peptidase (beta-lactamase class C family)